jgi:DNA (cytosine-5)-methyltransferase 1
VATGSKRLLAVDLFSGAGGLSQGLHDAGFSVVAAADHDPDACATYRANFAGAAVICGDLTAEPVREELLSVCGRSGPDLLVGGPPCQAFSQVRNHDRLLHDPRNRLYREFVRMLSELQPRAFVLENVPGLMQLHGGAVRWQIEEDVSLGGDYRVSSAVLDAGDFGVPQCRPRLIFIGVRRDLALPPYPRGTGLVGTMRLARSTESRSATYRVSADSRPELLDALSDAEDLSAVSVGQALGDLIEPGDEYALPPTSAYQRLMREGSDRPIDHVPSRIREDTRMRLAAIPPGGNIYDLPEELGRRYLTGKRWGPAGNGKRLARRHYYAYRRLHPDWLAWTANTKADFAYHYAMPRGLSVREAARIQGFPDRYVFLTAPPGTPGQLKNGARHSRYRQVGNAVPPPLACAVASALKAALQRDEVGLRRVAKLA